MSAATSPRNKPATAFTLLLAFGCLYFFWGSTYTAIRVGAAEMPALLFAGARFLIAGAILLAWCALRGLRLWWPRRDMALTLLIGLLLLSGNNVLLVYAEKTIPSGLAALVMAAYPLIIALAELFLPGGEPLSLRGWFGLVLGLAGLVTLMLPSLDTGFRGDFARLVALAVLLGSAGFSAAGTLVGRRALLRMDSFVGAAWQMLAGGAFNLALGTALGEWPQFRPSPRGLAALAYLVVGGSLIGYTSFVYLVERVPVAKVASYAYVNPVVAVLLGIFLLHERPAAAEFSGMAVIILAVFILTTSQIKSKPAD